MQSRLKWRHQDLELLSPPSGTRHTVWDVEVWFHQLITVLTNKEIDNNIWQQLQYCIKIMVSQRMIHSNILLEKLRSISSCQTQISQARNLCLSVCVCASVPVISLRDWPDMASAWFKGVQRRICSDYNDTVNDLFHKCFTKSASIANRSHHSHVRTRANHCRAQTHDIP